MIKHLNLKLLRFFSLLALNWHLNDFKPNKKSSLINNLDVPKKNKHQLNLN